jgi:hypothetical protein
MKNERSSLMQRVWWRVQPEVSIYWRVNNPWEMDLDRTVPQDTHSPADYLAGTLEALHVAQDRERRARERLRDTLAIEELVRRLAAAGPDEEAEHVAAAVMAVLRDDLLTARCERRDFMRQDKYWKLQAEPADLPF